MADLTVNLCGVKLENPIILASGAATNSGAKIRKAALEGRPGAIVTKSLSIDIGTDFGRGRQNPSPRGSWLARNRVALNGDKGEPFTLEEWLGPHMALAKEGGVPIIGSVSSRTKADEMVRVAKGFQEAGAAMIEINFGTPHSGEWGHGHVVLFTGPAREVAHAVKMAVDIPVIAKMPYTYTIDTIRYAKQLEDAGVDAISAMNAPQGTLVDIDGARIPLGLGERSGGTSGPGVKPLGLKMVKDLASTVKIPIIGIGGIESARDVVEYGMVGATCVQILTSFMLRGPRLFQKIKTDLNQLLEERAYASYGDVRGLALRDVGQPNYEPHVAEISKERCNGCGECEIICTWVCHSHPPAMSVDASSRKAVVNEAICEGCSWCASVCGPRAITLRDY